MSYIPGYLQYLDRNPQADGWPDEVTREGKDFCLRVLRDFSGKDGDPFTLREARIAIFRRDTLPSCLKGVLLLDAQYAITYRALLAIGAEQVWRLRL